MPTDKRSDMPFHIIMRVNIKIQLLFTLSGGNNCVRLNSHSLIYTHIHTIYKNIMTERIKYLYSFPTSTIISSLIPFITIHSTLDSFFSVYPLLLSHSF